MNEFHLQTAGGVFLKLYHLKPPYEPNKINLLIVGGLATTVESFAPLLAAASRHFEIHYLETREKKSAKLSSNISFHLKDFGDDLAHVFNKINSGCSNTVVMGYSLGATIVVEAYTKFIVKPAALVLLSPSAGFQHYPNWSFLLIRICRTWNEQLFKRFAKWYISRYVLNATSDPEMQKISLRAITNADASKIRATLLSNRTYSLWNQLNTIHSKTLVVGTSKDGIHQHEDVLQISENISGAEFVDLETNDRSHGKELAETLLQFIGEL